jgi:hypothetical protein
MIEEISIVKKTLKKEAKERSRINNDYFKRGKQG